jgi:hypothetical protein
MVWASNSATKFFEPQETSAMTITTTGAPGADQLSSQIDDSTSLSGASLTASKATEPIAMPALSKAQAGGHRVTRRMVMNVIVGGAATLTAVAISAPRPEISRELAGLIEGFYAANDVWLAAVDAAEEVERPNMSIKVVGGKLGPTVIIQDGVTTTLPERDWHFVSLDSIERTYKRELADAWEKDPATIDAIEATYNDIRKEAREQAQVIKKGSAEYRRAKAKVTRASREEQRALQAIFDFEPKSRPDALKLLEFAATEQANRGALSQANEVCFFVQKAHHVLSMVA